MRPSSTKTRIINTAIRLFGQYGYHNVSIRRIAEEVGIQTGSLYNHFDSKEAILEGTLERASGYLSHLRYTPDEISDMLRTRPPRQILKDFVAYYNDEDDTDRMAFYRLLYMEMYNYPHILAFVYEYFIRKPVQNLQCVLDIMMAAGAIPAGDSRAIAELWSRTSLVYGYMAAHGHENVSWDEYDSMTDFFIDLAVRGVRVIPVEGIVPGRRISYPIPDYQGTSDSTRDLILHKALDLFSQYGYAAVSVRQIAAASGIRPGSIYTHFTGKDALMQEIVDTFLTGVRKMSMVNSNGGIALETRNHRDIIRMLSFSCAPTESAEVYKVYRVLFREQYANPILGRLFLDTLQRDKQLIIQGNEEHVSLGIAPPSDIKRIAIAYVHTMYSLSIGATTNIHFAKEEHLRPRTVALLVSLIAHGYLDSSEPAQI